MSRLVENIFERLDRCYYDLTGAERRVADYALHHRGEVQFLSIGELAERSKVAEATVTRFCRRLGCAGYSAFKLALATASAPRRGVGAENSGDGDSLPELGRRILAADAEAMEKTLEVLDPKALDRAVELLEQAGRVLCMGQGGSMLMAAEAAHLFSSVSGKFTPVSDGHMQVMAAASLSPVDAVLYFSYSGATKDMADTLRVVREQGAKVILVTRFPRSPGAALADLVLQCASSESPLETGSVAARIAQLYLLDVLFARYCAADPEICGENRRRIAAALTEKHL